jgi:superfamily II DNA or RNA helicase
MSIAVSMLELNNEQKTKILDKLQIENGNKWIYPYEIKENDIFLPYAFARHKLGLLPPKRDQYTTINLEFNGSLRDYQVTVKTKAIQLLNQTGCCLLSLHVGWGKSILGIYLLTRLKFKTLIVVNKLLLLTQWKKEIESSTNATVQIITPKTKELTGNVFIINAINVPKLSKDFFQDIGTLIIDEIHLIMAEKIYSAMFRLFPKYVIALSATPYRPDGLNELLDIYCGSNKIIEKLFKPHIVYTIYTNLKITYDLQYNGKMDWNSLLQNQAEHPQRLTIIIDIIQKHSDHYFLVLCKRIAQGELIKNALLEKGENVTELLGTKSTFDENARIVVATTQKCGVGFSHSKLNALLLASDMEEYFIQYLGRVFRNPNSNPIIFDLVDNVSILKKHYQTRKKVYLTSGGSINEIHINKKM